MPYRFELHLSAEESSRTEDFVELKDHEYDLVVDLINRATGQVHFLRRILAQAGAARFAPTDLDRVLQEIDELRAALSVDTQLLPEDEELTGLSEEDQDEAAPHLEHLAELFSEASANDAWVHACQSA